MFYAFTDDEFAFITVEEATMDLERLLELHDPFSDYGLAKTASHMISALQFCHERHIIHRDIKPANVLLVGAKLKLSDFGLSCKMIPGEMLTLECGTPGYMAPELSMKNQALK
jgi:serine/threonine-protein kinase SIK2